MFTEAIKLVKEINRFFQRHGTKGNKAWVSIDFVDENVSVDITSKNIYLYCRPINIGSILSTIQRDTEANAFDWLMDSHSGRPGISLNMYKGSDGVSGPDKPTVLPKYESDAIIRSKICESIRDKYKASKIELHLICIHDIDESTREAIIDDMKYMLPLLGAEIISTPNTYDLKNYFYSVHFPISIASTK